MMVSALIEGATEKGRLPLGGGVFIAVVGPSGAGKDTVIGYARDRLSPGIGVIFVRRVITRASDGSSEDHDTLTNEAFRQADATGAFALSWEAHGLRYGIPANVDERIMAGEVAVANLSRAAIPALHRRYANVMVVEITAPPAVRAERLASRGREPQADVLARLTRKAEVEACGASVVTLDNGGPVEIAGEAFLALIRKAVAFADLSDTI